MHLFLRGIVLWVAAASLAAALQEKRYGPLGGAATVRNASRNAFGFPSPTLGRTERRAFFVGNSFFKQNWIESPASASARDGLGPLFNARSCSACHLRDGRSAPPEAGDARPHGLLLRIGVRAPEGPDSPHPVLGTQVQDNAISGLPPEARMVIEETVIHGSYGDGTRYELISPSYSVIDLHEGPLGDNVALGPRVAPALIGLGLLESIPREALANLADPDDADGDGISGRLHLLGDKNAPYGRFGWKATQPTVEAQVASAFVHDMGITSSLQPSEPLTGAQAARRGPEGTPPEIEDDTLARVVFYTQTLAVPDQRNSIDEAVVRGEALFEAFHCAACHQPRLETGESSVHSSYSNQVIRPYSDLLLHDLGPGLADGKRDGDAEPAEWRTPPLWGIGLVETVNGHTRFLHDGRARGLAEAILWHGGEAEGSREAFRLASASDREALLAFLRSL